MSPYNWSGSNARVFYVDNNGYLNWTNVNNTAGLRPIPFYNLKYLVKTKYYRIKVQDISLRLNL